MKWKDKMVGKKKIWLTGKKKYFHCHLHVRYIFHSLTTHQITGNKKRRKNFMFQNIDLITHTSCSPSRKKVSSVISSPLTLSLQPKSSNNTLYCWNDPVALSIGGTLCQSVMELLLHSNKKISYLFEVFIKCVAFPMNIN